MKNTFNSHNKRLENINVETIKQKRKQMDYYVNGIKLIKCCSSCAHYDKKSTNPKYFVCNKWSYHTSLSDSCNNWTINLNKINGSVDGVNK